MDLQLLNDAQVIRYPLNQWPLPRAADPLCLRAYAKDHSATGAAVTRRWRACARASRRRTRPAEFVGPRITGGESGTVARLRYAWRASKANCVRA
jgi:hypothetical protein